MEVDSKLKYNGERLQNALVSCPTLIKRNGILYNDVMSAPYPSPAELAHFASAVYSEMGDELSQELKLGDWELLTTARNDDKDNGYFGAAFCSPSLQQVVLAHRGTIPSNSGAWYTNIVGVVFNNYSSRMNSAATFAAKVKCAIEKANQTDGRRFHLSITGHSLGGWLAQVTGFGLKFLEAEGGKFIKIGDERNGLHAHVVAFDSPGCKDMLEEFLDTYDVRYGRTVTLDALDVSSYQSAPNTINTFGLHVGSIHRVMIDVSQLTLKERTTYKYSIKTHNMTNLKKALKDQRVIHEMEDWPASNIKEKVLKIWRNTEYKTFHDKVTHAAEYHLEPGASDAPRIFYKTKRPDNTASLRVFSDDELNFLNFWIIFKRERVQINNIQSFLTEHDLGMCDDLFVDFSIDMNNRTLTCAPEDLDMLVRRAKLLVRWFRAELMAAVDQQSKAIPKMMYSIINQKCLDSLTDDFLEFKIDSIKLEAFLESDYQFWKIKTEDRKLEMLRLSSVFRQLRELSAVSNMYVNHECHTFLHWKDIDNLIKHVDIANLPEDFTSNNLWVIDCDSTNVNYQIIKPFFRNIKKIIFVCDHKSTVSIEGFPVVESSFDSSQLTEDSQKKLFKNKMFDIGCTMLSIADFLGEQHFNCFSLIMNNFIDSPTLINILKSDKYVIKMKNSCPNFIESISNLSTIERGVSVENLARVASSGDLLVVSGKNQAELRISLTEASSGAADRVIWVPGTGPAGEEGFKRAILDNPDDKVYWLEVNDPSTASTVKQIYHKSFYLTRRFHRQVVFQLKDYAPLSRSKDIFIFQGAVSKESLASLLEVPARDRDSFIRNENILTAPSGGERNYGKPVHWLKLEENGNRFLWENSQGSLEGLQPHLIIDTVTEDELGASTQKVMIIADEPGMGKSTSLASMTRQMRTAWVIWINLKYFKNPSNNALTELEQLEELINDTPSLELLRFCLRNKHKRQLYCLFDGFDEVKDGSSKKAILKILQYLKNNTMAIIRVTTRFHDQELLEDGLSTIAVTFEKIEEQAQRDYLENFWRSHLLLEPGSYGDTNLKKCAQDVFTVAEENLGEDIQNFMGVPLQMRMLAEVFLQRVEDHITSHTESGTAFQVENVFTLYMEFIKLKYNIYCKGKIHLNVHVDDYIYRNIVTDFTKCHRNLGFRTLFPQSAGEFYEEYENTFYSQQDVLCRVGLVQSSGDGREVEFIHRTLAEYFCADQIVHWLSLKTRWHGWAPMVELLLSDILLQPSNYVIRMFLNNFLQLQPAPHSALEYIAAHIGKLYFTNKSRQTVLHLAAAENNSEIVNLLMIGGLGMKKYKKSLIKLVETRNDNERIALHYAAEWGNLAAVQLLAVEGANIDKADNYDRTALYYAAWEGHLPIVQWLAEKGADINKADYRGMTALYHAAGTGHLPLVQLLVEKGADINKADNYGRTALYHAAEEGHLPVVQLLAEKGADINKAGIDVITALYGAAEEGHLPVVQWLAEKGADIDKADNDGRTALYHVAEKGHLPLVQLLAEKGADIDKADNDGRTALYHAAEKGYLPLVQWLAEKGVDKDKADNDGSTALHRAVWEGHLPVVQLLAEKGADINKADNEGRTALYHAAVVGHLPVVQLLAEKGADVNKADNDDFTALHHAAWEGHLPVVQWLAEKGADINKADNIGRTALYCAAWGGQLPVVQLLAEKGADINKADNDGMTALHVAARLRHNEVAQYLEKMGDR